jgi:hypothetical protein
MPPDPRKANLIRAITDVEATFAYEVTHVAPGNRERRSLSNLRVVRDLAGGSQVVSVHLSVPTPVGELDDAMAMCAARHRDALTAAGLKPEIIDVLGSWIETKMDVHFFEMQIAELRHELGPDPDDQGSGGHGR